MLRRRQATAEEAGFEDPGDMAVQDQAAEPVVDEANSGRRHDRVRYATPNDPVEPQMERRRLDRRGLDKLRADLHFTYAPDTQPRGLKAFNRFNLQRSRLMLLGLALLAGGLAAFMASQINQMAPAAAPIVEQVAEVVPEARSKILVAKQTIGIGQRLTETSVGWEDWPEGAVLSDYVMAENTPDAMSELGGAVARFEFFPGDPIREQKLVRGARGYLSAVLAPGMRGVAVSVTPESASGGFISPNDHVDVVLTRTGGDIRTAETILQNVRVLAIGQRLGETGETGALPEGGNSDVQSAQRDVFSNQVIATLELDPVRAEVIIGATAVGQLSLMVRSMTDFGESDKVEDRGTNQAIRISSPFWNNDNQSGQR